MNSSIELRTLLDSIRAIALEGLHYTRDAYDRTRYQKLMRLVAVEYSNITGIPEKDLHTILTRELGIITPKLGIDVAIMSTLDTLLVIQQSDDLTWGLPGGWADVEETPFQTAVRESREETGLIVRPFSYICVSQKGPWNYPGLFHQVNICVATERIEQTNMITLSGEHVDYAWIDSKASLSWRQGHERIIRKIFEAYQKGVFITDITNM